MDTKWKNRMSEVLRSAVIGVSGIVCTVTAVWVILGSTHRVYYRGMSIALALSSALFLVSLADLCIRRADRIEDVAGRIQNLIALKRMARRAALVYFFAASVLLMMPTGAGGHMAGNSIFGELRIYGMFWQIGAIWFLPILSYLVPVSCRADRRLSELTLGLLDQSIDREEIMAELEERMKSAVEERVKSERMKIDLITNVSHDLKTPLTSVIGYIELMKKEENSDVMRDYLAVLTRKTDILKKMIENVFDLAKASSGSAPLERKRLDVSRLVRQVLADCDENLRPESERVKLDLADHVPVIADGGYLYRIVQNLVENSYKYALNGTRIFVRTFLREERVFLELVNVSAYPINFEPEEIRERFVRGDASRSTEGNGLGLAIVETFTNALGGRFDIEILGDTFKAVVSFPRADGKKEEEQLAEGVPV